MANLPRAFGEIRDQYMHLARSIDDEGNRALRTTAVSAEERDAACIGIHSDPCPVSEPPSSGG